LKTTAFFTILLFVVFIQNVAAQPWQNFSDRNANDIREEFKSPPAGYGMILWWGWDGPMTDTVIRRDLDRIKAMGFRGVMLEAGYGMTAKYLSPEWFEMVKIAVDEAKKRGMVVWIEDEGKYPSGFAGGKFSQERPDLKMQGLVVTQRTDLKSGESLSVKTAPGTVSAVAVNTGDNSSRIIDVSKGELNWQAPEGNWRVIQAGHKFRSSVTRSVNNPTRGKDTTASLMDYLNPMATKQFLAWTHEEYKKYIGSEFGKTFLGFMGDEPDFAYTPWTPVITEIFKNKKGYDVTPYLASFFVPQLSDEIKRVKADYWDVWSDLFRDNFFKVQADWCRRNNIEYIVHLNHEDQLPGLVKSSGDFFKNMRYVGVPGVDAIWAQIWPDHVADYPKLASSAAHLYGKPRAFTESFAAFTHRPAVPQAKWVIDYQLVRGINSVQIMFMSASANRVQPRSTFFTSDTFPPVALYINRATFLLSQGRPASGIGVYLPTSGMWLGDAASNTVTLAIAQHLLENQRDFDFVDEQALSETMTLDGGSFLNNSGQAYRTIIIPSTPVMSKNSLDRLRRFAEAGGKVIFSGDLPVMITDKNFLTAGKPGDLSWAIKDRSEMGDPEVLKLLTDRDLIPDKRCDQVKYVHRKLKDADLYFIFNEGTDNLSLNISLSGKGKAEEWNALTGGIKSIKNASKNGNMISLPVTLGSWETKFIVIKK
jgi:hypothetical protein